MISKQSYLFTYGADTDDFLTTSAHVNLDPPVPVLLPRQLELASASFPRQRPVDGPHGEVGPALLRSLSSNMPGLNVFFVERILSHWCRAEGLIEVLETGTSGIPS